MINLVPAKKLRELDIFKNISLQVEFHLGGLGLQYPSPNRIWDLP
jgi:hypothetical protein